MRTDTNKFWNKHTISSERFQIETRLASRSLQWSAHMLGVVIVQGITTIVQSENRHSSLLTLIWAYYSMWMKLGFGFRRIQELQRAADEGLDEQFLRHDEWKRP